MGINCTMINVSMTTSIPAYTMIDRGEMDDFKFPRAVRYKLPYWADIEVGYVHGVHLASRILNSGRKDRLVNSKDVFL